MRVWRAAENRPHFHFPTLHFISELLSTAPLFSPLVHAASRPSTGVLCRHGPLFLQLASARRIPDDNQRWRTFCTNWAQSIYSRFQIWSDGIAANNHSLRQLFQLDIRVWTSAPCPTYSTLIGSLSKCYQICPKAFRPLLVKYLFPTMKKRHKGRNSLGEKRFLRLYYNGVFLLVDVISWGRCVCWLNWIF